MNTKYRALIKDTILKELRSKTLIFIFIATTVMSFLIQAVLKVISSELGGQASVAISGVNFLSMNYQVLNWMCYFIAVIFGISTIRSDFQNNIIYQYLTFPISRAEYFFIRVLGTWILVLGYYVYAFLLSGVLYSLAFKSVVFSVAHLTSFFVMALYLLLVIFIAILFSMLMNKIGSLILMFFVTLYSAGAYSHFNELIAKEYFLNLSFFKITGFIFYMLFPRLEFLSLISKNILGGAPIITQTTGHFIHDIVHLIVISSAYIYLASYMVRKKDF